MAALLVSAGPAAAHFEDFYGMNAQTLFDQPQSSWDGHLATMSNAGLQLVRRDAAWGAVEPQAPDPATGAHSYHWQSFDTQVAAYARHHLRWLPIVDYSTTWSGAVAGDPLSAPARRADYVRYAAALAHRYGRGGDFWHAHPELPQLPVTRYEIWNEENVSIFWHPQTGGPERYADLYVPTRAAIRQVDPAARVIVGGLALANASVIPETDYVKRMYAHRPDLRGNVDGVGFHPYTATIDQAFLKIAEFRSTLNRVGAGRVPIEITEVGWTTTNTSDQDRAAALRRLAQELPESGCNVQSLIPHTWLTAERNAADPEHWFGIANANGTLKGSGTAYLQAVSRMRRLPSSPPRQICAVRARRQGGGPTVRIRVRRRSGRRKRLVALARCPGGCALTVELVKRVRGSAARTRRLGRRTLPFSARRRTVRLPIRGRRSLVELSVRAVGRSRRVTERRRQLRIRCTRAHSRRHVVRCRVRAVRPRRRQVVG